MYIFGLLFPLQWQSVEHAARMFRIINVSGGSAKCGILFIVIAIDFFIVGAVNVNNQLLDGT